jgi:AraC-like DNA-binding protein
MTPDGLATVMTEWPGSRGNLAPVSMPVGDGRRSPLGPDAFRHEYDPDLALGGWEFHALCPGLAIAVVDFVACRPFLSRHDLSDHFIISAVLEGTTPFMAPDAGVGEMIHGHCTLSGFGPGEALSASYETGCARKWVSVYIHRDLFETVIGIAPADLPAPIRAFWEGDGHAASQTVALSYEASLIATQLIASRHRPFERLWLRAKALELAYHALAVCTDADGDEEDALSADDQRRIRRARQLIGERIDQDINVVALAREVGLTRQRLQNGFRAVFGETAARLHHRLRMQEAMALVRSPAFSIIEIALSVGYEHPASFSRAFRSAFGMSPLQMRKTACGRSSGAVRYSN